MTEYDIELHIGTKESTTKLRIFTYSILIGGFVLAAYLDKKDLNPDADNKIERTVKERSGIEKILE